MKNPSPALSNDKNGTGLTQKIKKINVKSNAKDVETGEFNEMSLLDFLSEKINDLILLTKQLPIIMNLQG